MKRVIRILIPVILALTILLCMGWYLFVYDQEFTRDMLLQGARYFEYQGNHSVASWFYDLAYHQANDNDAVAIELAQQHKAAGNYTQAENTLSNAIADGGGVDLYIALCKTFVEQDKLLDAVRLLDAVCQENSTVDPDLRQALQQLRPTAPAVNQEPGFYSQYIAVTVTCDSGTLYVRPDGQYPSVEDAPYSEPVILAAGENNIYALTVADNGLVSPLSIFGYTVGGVIEQVQFADAAMEAQIRSLLGVNDDKVLFTNDLWTISEFTVPENAQNLQDLKHMIHLESLTIQRGPSEQLQHISSLAQLQTLTITDTAITAQELPVIGALPKLSSLTLQNCGLSTVAGLENAVSLMYLDLSKNTLRDISALGQLSALLELNLHSNALTSISALSGLQGLKALNVSNNALTTIAPAAKLSALTELDASHNSITDLTGLAQLTGLATLSVAHNVLTDVSALSNCTSLALLDISNNTITDIQSLSALNGLTKLDFSYNQVAQLPAFSKDCSLVTIDGSQNVLTDLEPLAGLKNLNNVYMDYNPELKSVTSLTSCHLLIQVNVYGTKVTDVKALTDMSVVVNFDPTQNS